MQPLLRLVPPHLDPDPGQSSLGLGTAAAAAPDLDALFREHAPYLARIAARLLGNRAEVDDLVQDVFIVAMRGISSLRDPRAARGWLATIAVRRARRALRRRRLRAFLHLEPELDLRFTGLGPETQAVLQQVYAHLERLPTNQRLAWSLRYLEGEPLEDVAALCECSLATAKRRIAAATRALAGTPFAPTASEGADV